MTNLINSDSVLEVSMIGLEEIKCVRCGSDKFKKGFIKKFCIGDDVYFSQLLKCKDCEHELMVEVKV